MDCCGTETAGVNDSLYVGVAAHGQFPLDISPPILDTADIYPSFTVAE